MDKSFNIASDLPESNMLNNGFKTASDLPSEDSLNVNGFSVAGDLPSKDNSSDSYVLDNETFINDNENEGYDEDDDFEDYMENHIKRLNDFMPFGDGEALVSSKKYKEMIDNGCNIISSKYWEDTDMYTITYEVVLYKNEEKTEENVVKLQLGYTNGFSVSKIPY